MSFENILKDHANSNPIIITLLALLYKTFAMHC